MHAEQWLYVLSWIVCGWGVECPDCVAAGCGAAAADEGPPPLLLPLSGHPLRTLGGLQGVLADPLQRSECGVGRVLVVTVLCRFDHCSR